LARNDFGFAFTQGFARSRLHPISARQASLAPGWYDRRPWRRDCLETEAILDSIQEGRNEPRSPKAERSSKSEIRSDPWVQRFIKEMFIKEIEFSDGERIFILAADGFGTRRRDAGAPRNV
jgi:hypothetical protein